MTTQPSVKLTRFDIVNRANKLVAELLVQQVEDFSIAARCINAGMDEKDTLRMEKQILKIAERLRRA